MTLPLVAIAFTAFAIAGLAHAINIIDGFHGLATGSGIIMLVAFAAVSVSAGDHDMASFCFIVASVLLGFLLVNFPFGYIFLGDGGAYFLGFVLASVAVMVPMRNSDISPWISMVILAYPLLETGFSVIRKIRRGNSPVQPDRLHLHMLVYRRLRRRLTGNGRLANPVTGVLMWGGAMTGLIAGVLVPHDRNGCSPSWRCCSCFIPWHTKSGGKEPITMIPSQRHLFDLPEDIAYLNCAYMAPLMHSVSRRG